MTHHCEVLPNRRDDWGLLTKPLGGAKFLRFRNIIMNCSQDDYGPVDMDALMAAHHRTIKQDVKTSVTNEPNDPENTRHRTTGSQECVGMQISGMWAAIRVTQKNQKTCRHTDTHGGCKRHIRAEVVCTHDVIAAE
jgi:hypothetical protein